MTSCEKWKTVASRYVVNDRWLKLRADTVLTPDGHTLDPFYIMEYSDWVNCFVIDDEMNAVFIRQYRHGAKEYVLELVAGGVEPHDETPKEAIERELLEEIGYAGGELFQTGISYANPANQTNKNYAFLAVGGACRESQALEKGENLHIEKVPLIDAVKRFTSLEGQEIYQSFHLANIFLALNFIKSSDDPKIKSLQESVKSLL